MRVNQYADVYSFINAFCECVDKIGESSCTVSPYKLTRWMLSEICVTHPDAASKVLQSIRDKKKDETNFDRKDFLKAAKDAKTYCFASFLS